MQASDAEVVMLEDSLVIFFFVLILRLLAGVLNNLCMLSPLLIELHYVVPVMHGAVGNRRRQFLPLYLWIPGKYVSKLFSWKNFL